MGHISSYGAASPFVLENPEGIHDDYRWRRATGIL